MWHAVEFLSHQIAPLVASVIIDRIDAKQSSYITEGVLRMYAVENAALTSVNKKLTRKLRVEHH